MSENGRSLKLRQSRQDDRTHSLPHPLPAQNRPRTKRSQPTTWSQGGVGVGREKRGEGREEKERQEGCQLTGKQPPPLHTVPPHSPPPHLIDHYGRGSLPPLAISSYRRFTRPARNRATVARFLFFGPNRLPPPRVLNWAAAPPPPPLSHHPSIPPYLPPPPFHTARPKPSHGGSVSAF